MKSRKKTDSKQKTNHKKTAAAEPEKQAETAQAAPNEAGAPKAEEAGKPEKPAKAKKTEKPPKPEKPQKVKKSEKPEKPKKAEKPEKVKKPEKSEKPPRAEKPPKPEKPGKAKETEKAAFSPGPWRWVLLAAAVLISAAMLTAAIRATSRNTVRFYDEAGNLISRVSVLYGQTAGALPYEDGLWRDESGELVEPLSVPVMDDISFYAWSTPSYQTRHGTLMTAEGSRFYPDETMTRADAAELIYALIADRVAEGHHTGGGFADLSAGDEHYTAVKTLYTMNLLQGYEDDTFRGDEPVTRAEFVSILYRMSGEECEETASFADVPENYWAANAIAYARQQGWVSGYKGGRFCPEAALTRAEAAVLAARVRGGLPDRTDIDAAFAGTFAYLDVTPEHWAYYEIIDAAYTSELLDLVLGQAENARPGLVFIGDKLCHVSAETLRLERYAQGMQEIDGALYYVKDDGFFIQRFQEGLLELDGSMFYVAEDDGPFLTDDYYGYLYFGPDGRYTSGSSVVDGYVDDILSGIIDNDSLSRSEKLYRAYCAIRDGGYYYRSRWDSGWPRGTSYWTRFCAEIMYEEKGGTCYYWASAFLYLARRLGYQAYAVCGGVGTGNQLHAWVVVQWDDGNEYICDVELEWAYIHHFYDVSYSTTDMYLQPLNATHVVYVFPGQSAKYYRSQGIAEESSEDYLNIPEEEQVPPSETPAETGEPAASETPAETEEPAASETPAETETPVESTAPAETEAPVESTAPVETEAPAEPEPTAAPAAPAEPVTPTEPETPVVSEQTEPSPAAA